MSLSANSLWSADKTWDGGGVDGFWQTSGNWDANTAPAPGDSLFFTQTTRLVSTNDFIGAGFSGITFSIPAGVFILSGNSISLDGGITNHQPLLTETIHLPLVLSGDRTVQVGNAAALTLGGEISGGFGLSKTGSGLLTLGAANTFNGPLTIIGGTVSIGADNNLGAVPAAPAAGNIVINGGALRSTANLAINANRGLALGATFGAGAGTLDTVGNTTLTYGGIIANNAGGTGGLTKLSFGGLTLSGASTYSGPTLLADGTLTLDFTQTTSPVDNIISSSSSLTLGGAPQGLNQTNFASLVMNGKAGVVNSQTFNGTAVDLGPAFIRANSGAGGTANLNLGALSPSSSGLSLLRGIAVFTPPSATGGAGNITTATGNTNGILGGWAFMGPGTARPPAVGFPIATNWATVDASGNIVNFTDFFNWASGNLDGQVTGASNLLIDSGSAVAVRVAAENAGATVDVNTVKILNPTTGTTLVIGTGNTLRLGRFGGILVEDNAGPVNYLGGNAGTQTGNGTAGSQNIGRLTAGGAPNTPGVVVITRNASSETAGSFILESEITDNGSAPVTVVKAGVGSIKIDGRNSYSGGLYILQGRVQFAANEIAAGTGNNHAGGGTGPIYILPGAYLFPNGPATNDIPNEIFIGGLGMAQEPGIGAIRFGNGYRFLNTLHLISDARIGSGTTANTFGGILAGRITGDYALDLGAAATINGNLGLSNPNNDWSGTTTLNARNTGGGDNVIYNLASEVIPHGLGKGSVVMNGNTGANVVRWDLNGFNETINGLSTANNGVNCFIQNSAGTTSTLTLGDNDQSGTFEGAIEEVGGTIALAKIGGGVQTLSGINTYTGPTLVNGGTLALNGAGAIANSQDIRVNSGTTLELSGVASDFTVATTLHLNNATLVANSANITAPSLNVTNSQLTLVPDTGDINITVTTLTTGGATNRINITTVAGVSSYPAVFPLIDYTTIAGASNNFAIGAVPGANTVGYLSNDVVNTRIVLVLLDGPKPLTWTGTNATNPAVWDIPTTTNWLAFKGQINEAPVAFNAGDSVFFDDTAGTNDVSLVGTLSPGGMSVNNSTLNYTFLGSGWLSGLGGLLKDGTATLTLANTGASDFRGGVSINSGSVIFASANMIAGGAAIASGTTAQVGVNSDTGNLPAGTVSLEGSLILNRGATAYTIANKIHGSGSITKNDTALTTFSGVNNTFTGAVLVAAGTLRAGNVTALGQPEGATTVSSGATLDLNGQTLNTEPVLVSGAGVGNNGVIVNLGAANQEAMGNVSLLGHSTFGGTARWDIRGGPASLTTSNNAYNLTKVGAGQFSLVGVTVDPALANITVSNGIFSVETTTDTLGNPASTFTVHTNGTLQLFNTTTAWDKQFVLHGGTSNKINNASGANSVAGPITLNLACIMNVVGTSLTLNGAISGSGGLTKIGGSPLILNGLNPYAGNTTVNAGTLVLNGINTSAGSSLSNAVGTTLSGRGTNIGPVRVNGAFQPGGPGEAGPFGTGSLTVSNAQIAFDIGTPSALQANDLILSAGDLTLLGTNVFTFSAGPVGAVTNGQIITLIQYTGTRTGGTNNLRLVAPAGYALSVINPDTTPGAIQAMVNAAPSILAWRGSVLANPTAWDISTTANWTNYTTGAGSSTFTNFDTVIFDDLGITNLVALTGDLQPTSLTMNNNAKGYTFTGSGRLTGISRLDVVGGGALVIANSASNNFTGPVNIGAGTLQVGNGGTGGNLGTGAVTNEGALIFNRDGNLTVANGIHGIGSLTNRGPGVVTLSGASTFEGQVMIEQGTLRAGSDSALGNPLAVGTTTIATGATLDVGGQTLNNEVVTVGGDGVGGLGAIINSGAASQNAMGNVTLTSDTTFGGTGRWDIRGTSAALGTSGLPYHLTKVGANQISLVGASVDLALANINVQSGIFAVETTTTGLGNPTNTLTVSAGATLQFFNSITPFDKVFVLNGNGTATTLNGEEGDEETENNIIGPITLNGDVIVRLSEGDERMALQGLVSGTGSLTRIGPAGSRLFLSGTNTYTGNTTVNGGTLLLSLAGEISNSAIITIAAGATLDVTGLAAGPTLVLNSGRTLAGNGSVNGALNALAGSTVSPGTSVGVLTITNNVTLQGTTTMELNAAANTNDALRSATGSITYGGTLNLVNLGGPLPGGSSFKLFHAGSYLNSFSGLNPPTPGPGQTWDTSTLNTDGTLRVVGNPATTRPVIVGVAQFGSGLVISGTNGTANGQYYVLLGTNILQPLATWERIATNNFINGNFNFTNTVDLNVPQRYYQIQLP